MKVLVYSSFTFSYLNRARVLYHALPCSPCKRRPSCAGRFDCMQRIASDEILRAAGEVLRA